MIITGLSLSAGFTLTPPPTSSGIIADTYFNYTTVLLSGDGTNNATNNTFVDSSTNNFAITRNGNTTQGTFSPYGPNWSNYFDNTGDYLTAPANTALAMGLGAFTMEAWVYNVGGFGTDPIFESRSAYTSAAGYAFLINSGGYLNVYTNSAFAGQSSTALVSGTWYHVALVRTGTGSNQTTYYINGVASGTITLSGNFTDASTQVTTIGGSTSAGENFSGYISNARIVKGTAVYTGAFTPSTTPLTAISGTSLLTCQSNRLIDNSTNAFAITNGGDVSVQRFSPFSPTAAYSAGTIGGSAYFDGTGDYLSAPSNAALTFGTGDFTVEFWICPTTNIPNYCKVYASGTSANNFTIETQTTTNTLAVTDYTATVFFNSSTALTLNAWTHVAVTRSGTALKLFQNGLLVGSTNTGTSFAGSTALIGSMGTTAFVTGYISNLRVVKGTAVYTTNFTPPTAPVTAITNTSLLLNFTNAGIIDNAMMNNLETVGDAKISTTQSKFGGSSMAFDGNLDYLNGGVNSVYSFGSGDFTIESWVYIVARGSSGSCFAGTWAASGRGWIWLSNPTQYGLVYSTNGTNETAIYSTYTIPLNTWTHLATVRNGNTITNYANGVSIGTGSVTGVTISTPTQPLYVGANKQDVDSSINNYQMNGYMNDFRITKGYARYTANFTPPTAALPTQ